MARGGLRRSARAGRFHEHLEIGRFAAGEGQPVGTGAWRPRATVQLVQPAGRSIHDVLRHDAKRGELAAGDSDQPARALDDAVLAGHFGCGGLPGRGQERSQPGPGGHDVSRREARLREEGVGRAEQIDDVVARGAHVVRGALLIGVGRADVALIPPRQHEHHAPVDRRGERHRVAVPEPVPRDHDMRALGAAQEGLRARVVEPPHVVHPGPRSVHDDERAHRVRPVAQAVAHRRAAHAAVRLDELRRFGVARHQCAGPGGALHRGDHQSGVVGLRIVVQRGAAEFLLPQARLQPQHGLAAEPAMHADVAERGKQVVQPHPGAKLPGWHPGPAVDGEEEGERPHQVRRHVE